MEDNAQLAALTVSDGPAVDEINSIKRNLVAGEALPQKVALAKRVDTGELLGFANVRHHTEPFVGVDPPFWLDTLRRHRYVGALARDDKYFKCRLADGKTWLGGALVRSVVELVTPTDELPPKLWAFAWRINERSHRAFEGRGFRVHPRSPECSQDVLVRPADEELSPPPGLDAYIPPPRPEPEYQAGRNDPCPCGSGKKFKKCHGR